MNTKLATITAACCAAFAFSAAHAQTSPPSYAGSQAKGELSTPNQDKGARPSGGSVTTRSEVKSDTDAAKKKAGVPITQGEASTPGQHKGPMAAASGPARQASGAMSGGAAPKDGSITRGERTLPESRTGTPRP